MTCSLVLVDQAFACHAVQNWLHGGKCGHCSFFVTGRDRSVNFLNESTHHGATASVMLTTLLSLDSALLSRLDISQGPTPKYNFLDISKAEDYAFFAFFCQWICANKRRFPKAGASSA